MSLLSSASESLDSLVNRDAFSASSYAGFSTQIDEYGTQRQSILMANVDQRLQKFSRLSDGWDGIDAVKPSPNAISSARTMMQQLAVLASTRRLPWVEPLVVPSIEGAVVAEWWFGNRKLSLYFSDSGIEFVSVCDLGKEVMIVDGDFDDTMTQRFWGWLTESQRAMQNAGR